MWDFHVTPLRPPEVSMAGIASDRVQVQVCIRMRTRSRVGQEHLGSIRSCRTQSLDEGTRGLLAPDGGTSRATPVSMTTSSKWVMTPTSSAVCPTPPLVLASLFGRWFTLGGEGFEPPAIHRGFRGVASEAAQKAAHGWLGAISEAGVLGRHGARGGRGGVRAGWARPRADGATWRLRAIAATSLGRFELPHQTTLGRIRWSVQRHPYR